jgi:hypothetical protein
LLGSKCRSGVDLVSLATDPENSAVLDRVVSATGGVSILASLSDARLSALAD